MADNQDDQASGASDASVLNDIATNGNLLNQNLSALTQAVGNLGSIVLPVPNGGTGLDHVGVGDLLVGDTDNTYTLLSDIATGNALISGGVNAQPSWGKIGLTTHVSGVLPVANGGTNASSFSAYALVSTGTTPTGGFHGIPSGTAGQVLVSNGAGAYPAFTSFTDGIGGLISFPQNGGYWIWLSSPFPFTVTAFGTICSSGSCVATLFDFNSNVVSNNVNTGFVKNNANRFIPAGGSLTINITSNSSCQGLTFMVYMTRTF